MLPGTLALLCALSTPVFVLAQETDLYSADFEAAGLPAGWTLHEPAKGHAVIEERPEGGHCLHLFSEEGNATLATAAPVPNAGYVCEFDFLQPANEDGGYQSVFQHARPEGRSFWWLEFGIPRFFLYTEANGWANRWEGGGYAGDTWLHIRVENAGGEVRVQVTGPDGQPRADSGWLPHSPGSPGTISLAAVPNAKGGRGLKVDNVRVYLPPIEQRRDFVARKTAAEAARRALAEPAYAALDAEGAQAVQRIDAALQAVTASDPASIDAYLAALGGVDAAIGAAVDRYRLRLPGLVAHLAADYAEWTLLDLDPWYNALSTATGTKLDATLPVLEAEGVPFRVLPFGQNVVRVPEVGPDARPPRIPIGAEAAEIDILLQCHATGRLGGQLEFWADGFYVELQYADGKAERLFPQRRDTGACEFVRDELRAYVVRPGRPGAVEAMSIIDQTGFGEIMLAGVSIEKGSPEPVDLREPVPPPAEIDGAVTLALTGDLVTVTGPTFTAQVSFEGVPTLTSVRDYSGRECLTRPSPLACFSLDDAPLMPEAFEDFEVRQEGHTVRCKFGTRDRKIGLVAVFTMAPEHEFGAAGGLRLDLRVTNSADGVRSPLASFPVVSGLDLGAGCRYLFPQRGGCSSDRPLDIQAAYGGMAWMQMVSAWRPEDHWGVGFRVNDSTGLFKYFSMKKLIDGQEPRRHGELPSPTHIVDCLDLQQGVGMMAQYLPQPLGAGESFDFPSVTFTANRGGLAEAIGTYRDWAKTWWHNRPTPEPYRKGMWALVGGPPPDDGEQFGRYDWWHLSPLWTIDYVDNLGEELDFLREQAGRAGGFSQWIGLYIEGMIVEKHRQIGKERGAKWAMLDDKGQPYPYYGTPENPVWNLCPEVPQWRAFDAAQYAEILRRVPLKAMYVDSAGSRYSELCFNPAHHHRTPGIWPQGCGKLFSEIRQATMAVDPECAIHSEEPGCDYMAMHEDGSWSHSLWTAVSGEDAFNPEGRNYFRFAFPQFKMYEIPTYQHSYSKVKLAFFNGEGVWASRPVEAKLIALYKAYMPVMRKYADVFTAEGARMGPATGYKRVFANTFSDGKTTLYTLYNANDRTVWLDMALPAQERLTDAVTGEAVGEGALEAFRLHPREVRLVVVE